MAPKFASLRLRWEWPGALGPQARSGLPRPAEAGSQAQRPRGAQQQGGPRAAGPWLWPLFPANPPALLSKGWSGAECSERGCGCGPEKGRRGDSHSGPMGFSPLLVFSPPLRPPCFLSLLSPGTHPRGMGGAVSPRCFRGLGSALPCQSPWPPWWGAVSPAGAIQQLTVLGSQNPAGRSEDSDRSPQKLTRRPVAVPHLVL